METTFQQHGMMYVSQVRYKVEYDIPKSMNLKVYTIDKTTNGNDDIWYVDDQDLSIIHAGWTIEMSSAISFHSDRFTCTEMSKAKMCLSIWSDDASYHQNEWILLQVAKHVGTNLLIGLHNGMSMKRMPQAISAWRRQLDLQIETISLMWATSLRYEY